MREHHGILIIDDDIDFCCLLQIAFQEAEVGNPIETIHDGLAAVQYLRQFAPGGAGGIIPGLVLLDLRMPGLGGVEVLSWMRKQGFLAELPVVVFTGMEGGKELSQAQRLGATTLHPKPFSYRDLVREAKELRDTYLEPHELRHAA